MWSFIVNYIVHFRNVVRQLFSVHTWLSIPYTVRRQQHSLHSLTAGFKWLVPCFFHNACLKVWLHAIHLLHYENHSVSTQIGINYNQWHCTCYFHPFNISHVHSHWFPIQTTCTQSYSPLVHANFYSLRIISFRVNFSWKPAYGQRSNLSSPL